MADITLRFHRDISAITAAGLLEQTSFESEPSVTSIHPGQYLDVPADDTLLNIVADTKDYMASVGWAFVEQDPSTSLEQAARDDMQAVLDTP